jgi:hypothetical protein
MLENKNSAASSRFQARRCRASCSGGDESGGDSENVARRQRRDGGTRENVATAAAIMTALQRWQRA